MNGPRIGSLFSGYGGLDMGVTAAIGGSVAWHVEFDEAPSKILAHHWPEVPNYGDVTKVDWAAVEPIDVLTGGFPCQDVSLAGARRGMKDGTRSGLWSEYAQAIRILKPRMVVIENVRGLLSADASSGMEPCPECVGDGPDAVSLRALGAVLGDLADLAYDAEWCGLRAADAGAPHGRFRVFIVAHSSSFTGGTGHGDDLRAGGGILGREPHAGRSLNANTAGSGCDRGPRFTFGESAKRIAVTGSSKESSTDSAHIGHKRCRDARGRWTRPEDCRDTAAYTRGERGNESDISTGVEGKVADRAGVAHERSARSGSTEWGVYLPAITRWETVTGRTSPAPTNPDGKNGSHRLSAHFVEFMMGLPAGHVTNPAIGLTRNQQLKALGNGVVPQQAELAMRVLLGRSRTEIAVHA